MKHLNREALQEIRDYYQGCGPRRASRYTNINRIVLRKKIAAFRVQNRACVKARRITNAKRRSAGVGPEVMLFPCALFTNMRRRRKLSRWVYNLASLDQGRARKKLETKRNSRRKTLESRRVSRGMSRDVIYAGHDSPPSANSSMDIPVSFGASCADWEDTNSEGLRQVSFQNALREAGASLQDMNAEVQLTLESKFMTSEAEVATTAVLNSIAETAHEYREVYRDYSLFHTLGGKSRKNQIDHRAVNFLFVNEEKQALFLNVSGFSRGAPQWQEERMTYVVHARGPLAFAQKFIDDLKSTLDPLKDQDLNTTDDDVEIYNCIRDSMGNIQMYPHDYHYPYQWEKMRGNYAEKNQQTLSDMVGSPLKFEDGRLIILYGATGTGKTWFIRSLIREWYPHYLPIVVQDVENFMTEESYYMNLLQQSDDINPDRKAPLIILEDAGQTLIRNGQQGVVPIQRLLNRTDGLCIGDRNTAFLITFNEEIGDIDKAVVREGRCRASIEFHPLSVTESQKWLQEKGCLELAESVFEPMSIADLFGMVRNGTECREQTTKKDQTTIKKTATIGFGL